MGLSVRRSRLARLARPLAAWRPSRNPESRSPNNQQRAIKRPRRAVFKARWEALYLILVHRPRTGAKEAQRAGKMAYQVKKQRETSDRLPGCITPIKTGNLGELRLTWGLAPYPTQKGGGGDKAGSMAHQATRSEGIKSF